MAFLHESSNSKGPAPEATVPPPDYKAVADRLLSAANDGSKSLKTLFFWYIGALTYAVISVAGVADEQLLRETPLKLPILNVDIPLVEYFAFLPLVVVLIHLELLVQFALLSNKINDFRDSIDYVSDHDADDYRLQLDNFMLLHLLAGKHRSILHSLLFLLIYASLVLLPLFSLLLIQAQFLPYHSDVLMWWHRALILFDCLALLYLWPNLFNRQDIGAGIWVGLMTLRVLPRVIALLVILFAIYALLAWLHEPFARILVVLSLGLVVCLLLSILMPVPRKRQRRKERRREAIVQWLGFHSARLIALLAIIGAVVALWVWAIRDRLAMIGTGVKVPLLTIATMVLLAILVEQVSRGRNSTLAGLYRRSLQLVEGLREEAKPFDAPGLAVFAVQCLLGLAVSWFVLSVPSETEPKIALHEVCKTFISKRPADSPTPDRPKQEAQSSPPRWLRLLAPMSPPGYEPVEFEEDDDWQLEVLFCADDWDVMLAGDGKDQLRPLSGLILNSLGMQRVLTLDERILAAQELSPEQRQMLADGNWDTIKAIEPVVLDGRNLTGAQLEGAVLPRAKADEATRFNGTVLDQAQLQGAIFDQVSFDGASLLGTNLQGASLASADFSQAITIGAQFQGAVLNDANFAGTRLSRLAFHGADLRKANLSGTSLVNTILVGALAGEVNLRSAVVVNAQLQGATFERSNPSGYADLVGALLSDVEMQGSDLSDADLTNSIIIDPRVGRLTSYDAVLMHKDPKLGESYGRRQIAFEELIDNRQATRWPQSSGDLSCLLIINERRILNGTYPNCRFVSVLGGGYHGDDEPPRRSYSELAPTRSTELQAFWRGYGEAQASTICDAPTNAARRPLNYAASLSWSLTLFNGNADIRNVMTAGALPILMSEDCEANWTREAIESARNVLAKRDQSKREFYNAWLAALERQEANKRSEEPPAEEQDE